LGAGDPNTSGAGDVPADIDRQPADGGKGSRQRLKLPGRAVIKPSRMGAAGRRAQQTARDGMVAARKEATERATDAARRARDVALPRLSQASAGVRQRVAVDPEVAEQVTVALMTAMTVAAGKHSIKISHPAIRVAGAAIMAVGPTVATHTGRQVRKGFEWNLKAHAETADGPSTDGQADGVDRTGEVRPEYTQGSLTPSPGSEAMTLSELADVLGVRQPPDPDALYRPGLDFLEPPFPLPENLASLPWSSLSHCNRFSVLVAAWALREADGIQLLKAAQLEQAGEVFQTCLIRAELLQTPELIARSYEDLGELAVAAADEGGARKWRAEAERVRHG